MGLKGSRETPVLLGIVLDKLAPRDARARRLPARRSRSKATLPAITPSPTSSKPSTVLVPQLSFYCNEAPKDAPHLAQSRFAAPSTCAATRLTATLGHFRDPRELLVPICSLPIGGEKGISVGAELDRCYTT